MKAPEGSGFHRAGLLPRIATAVVGAPLLLLGVWLGGLLWIILMAVVVTGAAAEFVRLHPDLRPGARAAVIAGSVGMTVIVGWTPESIATWLLGVGGIVVLAGGIIPRLLATPAPRPAWTQPRPGWYGAPRPWLVVALGVMYLGVPIGVLTRWRLTATFEPVAWFLVIIWVNDIAAYVVGLAFGRHKLAPRISPGKSWEGALAGVGAAAAVAVVAAPALAVSSGAGSLLGVIVGITSQIGDLFESALKRQAGVKDSGALLPGHGGILDRFDGLLFAAPVGYVFLRM